jgi:hypothetical protein
MKSQRVLTALVVGGVAIADAGCLLAFTVGGGFKYLGLVPAGLAAATIGLIGIGLSGRR